MNKALITFFALSLLFVIFGQDISAQVEKVVLLNQEAQTQNNEYSIRLDKETIGKGYTVTAFEKLKLSLVPGILNEATQVQVLELNEEMPMPWKFEKISKTYQFEFKTNRLTIITNHFI